MKSPVASFVKIALAASRSSAFLAAFVGSVYAGYVPPSPLPIVSLMPVILQSMSVQNSHPPPPPPLRSSPSLGRWTLRRSGSLPVWILRSDREQAPSSRDGSLLRSSSSVRPALPSSRRHTDEMCRYALMDELVPTFLSVGARGELISRWIERFIFALSTGTVISATVHRPDLVSGVVRGIMGKAIGDWGAVQRR